MVQVDASVDTRNNGPDLIIPKWLGRNGTCILVQRSHFLRTAIS